MGLFDINTNLEADGAVLLAGRSFAEVDRYLGLGSSLDGLELEFLWNFKMRPGCRATVARMIMTSTNRPRLIALILMCPFEVINQYIETISPYHDVPGTQKVVRAVIEDLRTESPSVLDKGADFVAAEFIRRLTEALKHHNNGTI